MEVMHSTLDMDKPLGLSADFQLRVEGLGLRGLGLRA